MLIDGLSQQRSENGSSFDEEAQFPTYTGINYFQQIGIGNAVSDDFPVITNDFTTNEGNGENGDNIDNGLRFDDSVDWQKGRHSLTIGTDLRYQQYSPINNNAPSIGLRRWARRP